MRTFWIAAVTEFVSFFLVVINNRAFNQGLYGWTALTDAMFITQNFFVNKWMIEDETARGLQGYLGFLIGGTLGSVFAIFVSKHVYGR